MRRLWIAATAFLAGAISFPKENESPKCKDLPCAIQPVATIPEQPHASEESPTSEVPEGWVVIMDSPPTMVERDKWIQSLLIK
jgi:hypothetical protein